MFCFSSGKFDVSFEAEGMHGWKLCDSHEEKKKPNWYFSRGITSSPNTGPNQDHTSGSGTFLGLPESHASVMQWTSVLEASTPAIDHWKCFVCCVLFTSLSLPRSKKAWVLANCLRKGQSACHRLALRIREEGKVTLLLVCSYRQTFLFDCHKPKPCKTLCRVHRVLK